MAVERADKVVIDPVLQRIKEKCAYSRRKADGERVCINKDMSNCPAAAYITVRVMGSLYRDE